ncbi:broad substrate specificity ATP-binding cassette transporter ABCG2-like [Clavelina lepadiformis]|uniref:broad substrate specificity ATP-binding cassette transporter ABCG2-like n=1 Tax=Clavelina lepadiformis TaxID=159417 RepID=UPI0040438C74
MGTAEAAVEVSSEESVYVTAKSEMSTSQERASKYLSKSLSPLQPKLRDAGYKLNKSEQVLASMPQTSLAPGFQNNAIQDVAVQVMTSETCKLPTDDPMLTSTPHGGETDERDCFDADDTTCILPAQTSQRARKKVLSVGRLSNISLPRIFVTPASPQLSPSKQFSESRSPSPSAIEYALHELDHDTSTNDVTTSTLGECVDIRGALTMSYHDITMDVDVRSLKVKIAQDFLHPGYSGRRRILEGLSGIFPPGLNVIMGPSGSGKSSLLKVLSGRHGNKDVKGRVLVNGRLVGGSFKQKSGFLDQEDFLSPNLTVRQHIWYALCLRRHNGSSKAEKLKLLDEIVRTLDLDDCADTKVGTIFSGAVSSGERKRTAVGVELASAPKFIFMDEPTSKLDAHSSKSIMATLRRLANSGRTIVIAIHQPSYDIYRMFDTLTLIARGRTVFHGNASQALEYFSQIGYEREKYLPPPDFFLDILYGIVQSTSSNMRGNAQGRKSVSLQRSVFYRSVNNNREHVTSQNEAYLSNDIFSSFSSDGAGANQREQAYSSELDITTTEGAKMHRDVVEQLHNAYVASALFRRNKDEMNKIENALERSINRSCASSNFWDVGKRPSRSKEYAILFRRMFRASSSLFLALATMNLIIGLIYGFLYHPHQAARTTMQNRLGMFFQMTIYGMMVPAMVAAKNFAEGEKVLFMHERDCGHYHVTSYFLARLSITALARALSAVAFTASIYWLSGLLPLLAASLNFMAVAFCAGIALDAISLFSALLFECFSSGRNFVILYMSLTSIFSGYLLDLDSTFPWIAWIKYVSVARYCYLGWVINEFSVHEPALCPGMATEERHQKAISIKARLLSLQNGADVNVSECTYYPDDVVLPQVVGSDTFLLTHPWMCQIILVAIAMLFFVLSFWRMKRC